MDEHPYDKNKYNIDLSTKKTNYDWAIAQDNFIIKATPKIFEVIEWIFITSAVVFIARKSDSIIMKIFQVIPYIFLYMYFFVISIKIEIRGIPYPLGVSAIFAVFTSFFSTKAIGIIVEEIGKFQ